MIMLLMAFRFLFGKFSLFFFVQNETDEMAVELAECVRLPVDLESGFYFFRNRKREKRHTKWSMGTGRWNTTSPMEGRP